MNLKLPGGLLWPIGFGLALNALHFWMRFRLLKHGLPVKWLMWFGDDSRMWQQYREQARLRNWAVWPYYAYWTLWRALLASMAMLIPVFRGLGQ